MITLLNGPHLQARRVSLGLTVAALAAQLGIGSDLLRAIENSATSQIAALPLDVLLQLAHTLHIAPAELFSNQQPDPVAASADDRAVEAALLAHGDTPHHRHPRRRARLATRTPRTGPAHPGPAAPGDRRAAVPHRLVPLPPPTRPAGPGGGRLAASRAGPPRPGRAQLGSGSPAVPAGARHPWEHRGGRGRATTGCGNSASRTSSTAISPRSASAATYATASSLRSSSGERLADTPPVQVQRFPPPRTLPPTDVSAARAPTSSWRFTSKATLAAGLSVAIGSEKRIVVWPAGSQFRWHEAPGDGAAEVEKFCPAAAAAGNGARLSPRRSRLRTGFLCRRRRPWGQRSRRRRRCRRGLPRCSGAPRR
jgi:transcriptional regulator with XRE-family HTH domain